MRPFRHVADILRYVERNYSNPKALNYYKDGEWHHISTQSFVHQVKHVALGLVSLGLKRGDKVGILAESSPFWTIADMAVSIAGGVSVPLFSNMSDENFDFEVKQTELHMIFVSGKEQWDMLSQHEETIGTIISLNGEKETLTLKGVIGLGEELARKNTNLYNRLERAIQEDDPAAIIYTSGSTGFPKGAVHTHKNLVGIAHLDAFKWDGETDRYLSLLPLAHIFSRTLNLMMLAWGVSIYYWSDLKNLPNAFKEIHPTFMIVVPRLLEKLYNRMIVRVEKTNFLSRAIGKWAFRLAHIEGKSLYKWLFHPLADKLVFSKLRKALGGAFRVILSGGAHLNPHLYHFYLNAGFPIYEGWGLTEASTVTVNRLEKFKVGSVGPPLGDLEIRISPEQEILVRGSTVMKEYYLNPAKTAETIDAEGWLHTGDKGTLDGDNYLTIAGRTKELYKTSTGEFISPIPLEHGLCKSPLIDMAMVIAEDRKFVSCLLFPDREAVKELKKRNGQTSLSDEEFLTSKKVKKQMDALVEKINGHVNHWEQIHAYRFILEPPSINGGELTPTMKLKRNIIEEKYHDLIDKMYIEEAA